MTKNCSILSQKVPKFELYKHNDEVFNIYYGIFFNCVRQRRPVSKMAAITKNRNFFKWPKLLYFKPESAQI